MEINVERFHENWIMRIRDSHDSLMNSQFSIFLSRWHDRLAKLPGLVRLQKGCLAKNGMTLIEQSLHSGELYIHRNPLSTTISKLNRQLIWPENPRCELYNIWWQNCASSSELIWGSSWFFLFFWNVFKVNLFSTHVGFQSAFRTVICMAAGNSNAEAIYKNSVLL